MTLGNPHELELPEVVESTHVFDRKMVGLRVDSLRWSDGTAYDRTVVEYGVAVVLVPVTANGSLLLVRQYRHPVQKWLLELPAGGMDAEDPSPEAAAQRELREETGYRGTLTRIGGLFLAPGYSDEYQHIFVAQDLVEDALEADEDEDLRLEHVPLTDVVSLVADEQICDAKSIAALQMYLRWSGRISI